MPYRGKKLKGGFAGYCDINTTLACIFVGAALCGRPYKMTTGEPERTES